jgi:hypothetical protein
MHNLKPFLDTCRFLGGFFKPVSWPHISVEALFRFKEALFQFRLDMRPSKSETDQAMP